MLGISLSANGERVAVASTGGGAIYIYDAQSGEQLMRIGQDYQNSEPGAFRWVRGVAVGPNGQLLRG